MIRVLQCVNNMHRAGLETMLMNYYRHIDRNEIQFDFLTHRPERADYDDEIERLGGKVYYAPRLYPQNYASYFSFMKRFFRGHPEYQIVHAHIDAMSYLPLMAAKCSGVPIRIAHSHSTSIDRDLKYPIKQGFRLLLPTAATHRFSCGQAAGEFLFRGKDFTLIPNAVEREKYQTDPALRKQMRAELGLENRLVLGHVGRFSYPKNHEFLLDIFVAAVRKDTNARLMLIGTGENEASIREKVRQLSLMDKVYFLGSQAEVARFYQAMDVFVMPSRFEGVPLTGVEAQFSGLPCVFSDRVPTEVAFTEGCSFLPLEAGTAQWAEHVLACAKGERPAALLTETRFDIHTAADRLADTYRQLLTEIK